MTGLWQHLLITLRLNFRSKQALAYGYLVPIFFLVAFGSLFRQEPMGQLLVITMLGGACFGMPTAMVSERERGVWRRYRMLPTATGSLIFSTMVARFLIVSTAAILQIFLARWWYKIPFPAHPFQLAVAFSFVAFAFLGMGLVIAMLADTVPAVQALGQSIFLPMIIIGGVGVPLHGLPTWAQHAAGFLPGYYAVQALDACIRPDTSTYAIGLYAVRFDVLALVLIGVAACFAGARLFRWDAGQKFATGARAWALLAVLPWAAVGLTAEAQGRLGPGRESELPGQRKVIASTQRAVAVAPVTPSTGPTTTPTLVSGTQPTSSPTELLASLPHPATGPVGVPDDWQAVTPAQLGSITYADLEGDDGAVTPVAQNLDNLTDDGKKRLDDLRGKLADWKPAAEDDVPQRVRNVLSWAAVPDFAQDPNESEIPLIVFEQLKNTIAKDDLEKALAYVILKPDEGSWVTKIPELGFEVELPQGTIQERGVAYAKKLLGRLLGKLPAKPAQ